jgi:hypothetical protein
MSAPPRSKGLRLELADGFSLRGLPCHCADEDGNIYSASLQICRVVLLLLRQRRGAAGNGLGTTITPLRRTTSGTSGNGLDTTIKYLRQTTSGAMDGDFRVPTVMTKSWGPSWGKQLPGGRPRETAET